MKSANEIFSSDTVLGKRGDPNGEGCAGDVRSEVEVLDSFPESFRHDSCAGFVCMGQQRDELIAAIASEEVVHAQDSLKTGGDVLEHPIAGLVSEVVVDLLEVVDVDEDQAEMIAGALAAADFGGDLFLEEGVVVQAGETVADNELLELLVLGAQFFE